MANDYVTWVTPLKVKGRSFPVLVPSFVLELLTRYEAARGRSARPRKSKDRPLVSQLGSDAAMGARRDLAGSSAGSAGGTGCAVGCERQGLARQLRSHCGGPGLRTCQRARSAAWQRSSPVAHSASGTAGECVGDRGAGAAARSLTLHARIALHAVGVDAAAARVARAGRRHRDRIRQRIIRRTQPMASGHRTAAGQHAAVCRVSFGYRRFRTGSTSTVSGWTQGGAARRHRSPGAGCRASIRRGLRHRVC